MALARKAARSEKAGEDAQAYIFYSEAAALQPRNRRYRSKMTVLQTRAAKQSKPQPRPIPGQISQDVPPVELSVEDAFDSLTEREMSQARELKGLPQLQGKPGKQDFDLNLEARGLFDKVAERFGLQTVFDGDYPKDAVKLPFRWMVWTTGRR